MRARQLVDDLDARVASFLQQTPAADVQKLKTELSVSFAKLDLITRKVELEK